MPQSHRDISKAIVSRRAIEQRDRSTEPLEDEEKILAGRPTPTYPLC